MFSKANKVQNEKPWKFNRLLLQNPIWSKRLEWKPKKKKIQKETQPISRAVKPVTQIRETLMVGD